jgi:hypothetical protein
MLLLFYLLSTGPANVANHRGQLSDATVRRIYFPLVWLVEHNETAAQVVEWYVDKWN